MKTKKELLKMIDENPYNWDDKTLSYIRNMISLWSLKNQEFTDIISDNDNNSSYNVVSKSNFIKEYITNIDCLSNDRKYTNEEIANILVHKLNDNIDKDEKLKPVFEAIINIIVRLNKFNFNTFDNPEKYILKFIENSFFSIDKFNVLKYDDWSIYIGFNINKIKINIKSTDDSYIVNDIIFTDINKMINYLYDYYVQQFYYTFDKSKIESEYKKMYILNFIDRFNKFFIDNKSCFNFIFECFKLMPSNKNLDYDDMYSKFNISCNSIIKSEEDDSYYFYITMVYPKGSDIMSYYLKFNISIMSENGKYILKEPDGTMFKSTCINGHHNNIDVFFDFIHCISHEFREYAEKQLYK